MTLTGGGGRGEAPPVGRCGLTKDDVWILEPLAAVELLTGECTRKSKKGFETKLMMLRNRYGLEEGLTKFRMSLEAVLDDWAEFKPSQKFKTFMPGPILHHKCKLYLGGNR